jgi:membrane protein YdbS with pleckstrin-like domain
MRRAIGSSTTKKELLTLAGIKLQDDERLLTVCSIHQAIYWKAVAVALFGVLLFFTFTFSTLGLFFLFVAACMGAIAYLTRRYLLLAATDKRIFIRSGILYADMIEMRYTQTESVELGMTPIGQIFGYGNVIVTGTGQRRVIVPFIKNAYDFRSKVNDVLVNK